MAETAARRSSATHNDQHGESNVKLKQIGSNMTVLTLNSGTDVLFSYETPVAGHWGMGYFETDTKFSKTTSRHINKYLDGETAEVLPQKEIEDLVALLKRLN